MPVDRNKGGDWNKEPGKPYDLTQESSRRGNDPEAANEARNAENDAVSEETNLGFVSSPEGDRSGENRVTTSISED